MMKANEPLQIGWGPCCFCGQDISKTDVDPCFIKVETSGGKWQVWVCHAKCFKSRIASGTEVDLSPAHF